MYKEMQKWIQSIVSNMKLTEYRIGTVVALNPLKIDFGERRIVTDVGTNILLTESVLEKKLIIQKPEGIDTYIINEGLKLHDKVMTLKVESGQRFIVLSKLRATTSLTVTKE